MSGGLWGQLHKAAINGVLSKDVLKLQPIVATLSSARQHDVRRHKSTGISLSTSFNSKLSLKSHLSKSLKRGASATGLFGIPELATPEGFKVLEDRAVEETNRLRQTDEDTDWDRYTETEIDGDRLR